ncbi:ATP-binding cassette, sub-B (MDR TAP), member 8 [Kappamyces sp. JEL0680]|nr:ATP-binding cassette, sub-B (MDR TAP), member 8 [Kappamyces sp. JEL0680]
MMEPPVLSTAVEKLQQTGSAPDRTVADPAVTLQSNWLLIKEIWKHLKKDWLLLWSITLITCASAAINIYTPLVIGQLVTVVQTALKTGQTALSINGPALQLLGLFSLQGFLTFINIWLVTRLGENLASSIRTQLFFSILSQDLSFFDSRMGGEIGSRLTTDLSEFKHTFKLVITQGLKAATQTIGSILSLISLSPSLTLTLASTLPFLYVFMNVYGAYLRRLSRRAKLKEGEASSVAQEAIANIKTVKAFVTELEECRRYTLASQASSVHSSYLGFHIGIFQGLTNTSIGSMILLILYFGGKQVFSGQMTGGDLMSYMVATQNTQKSLASVGVLFGQTIKAFGSAARVFEYIATIPKIPTAGGHYPSEFKGEILFQNVDFNYPTRKNQVVLKNFSLHIPVGSIVALCGSSGSGKSTIGQLIERFYDVDGGRIFIDGHDICTVDPRWLRRNIGYINQEPTLFATSIRENIRYACPTATDEQVEWAAKESNAHEFILKFPDGYNTVVGERGSTLSGGQKQRIAIARALLKSPKVLILDEATSALDNQSERLVQEALDRLMKGRTVLVIAHRLSTIHSADRIVVLSSHGIAENGNILEDGTHRELMAKRGIYWRLYQQLAE